MKFNRVSNVGGNTYYAKKEEMKISDFFFLMNEIARILKVKLESISIPEAEIIKMTLGNGEIYAKYDLDYDIEIDCNGMSDEDQNKIESILMIS